MHHFSTFLVFEAQRANFLEKKHYASGMLMQSERTKVFGAKTVVGLGCRSSPVASSWAGPKTRIHIIVLFSQHFYYIMNFALIQKLECIGRGSYGDVHRGLTSDGIEVAIKLINLEDV